MSDLVIRVVKGVRLRRADDQNVTIERFRIRKDQKTGEPKPGIWDVVGFYPSLEVACEALTHRHMHLVIKEQGTLLEMIEALRELSASLKKHVKRVETDS